LLLLLIFWQPRVRIQSNGVVEAPTHIVYAPESGYVSHVGYDDQRNITSGRDEPLVVLNSPELALAQSELQSSASLLLMQRQEASATQERATGRRLLIEQSLLDERMQSLQVQNASLSIAGPAEGDWFVDGMPPGSVIGRYFASGDPIVTLVSQRERFIEVIVDQRDLYLLSVGNIGRIRFAGVGPRIYPAKIDMISPVAKLEGIEQSVLVRMAITIEAGEMVPPLGLSGELIILGEKIPLWRHFFHTIRKVLRADLWL
jgi:multidrug resistance efflux pump